MWAKTNLRFRASEPMLDVANALRILDKHEDFQGRFRYNPAVNKVLDRGSVMLDWRVSELIAVIQERFLPEIPDDCVKQALLVHANRVIQK